MSSCAQAVQNVEIERKLASEQQLQQKQARKAELRDAHLMQIRRKALDESTKVHEVLFINKLQKEDKELTLMQRMQVCPMQGPLCAGHSLVMQQAATMGQPAASHDSIAG